MINLISSRLQLGRPLATPPRVPMDRVTALRKAFVATMKNSAFREQAAKMNLTVDPVAGEDMQAFVAELLATPAPIAARAQEALDW